MLESPSFDFAVVGAGLTGLSLAYGLARLGKSVVVLERLDKSQSLHRPAHGLLWAQANLTATPVQRELNNLALAGWCEFDEQLCHISASVTHYERPGGIWLATDPLALQGRQLQAEDLSAQACELEWLSGATLRGLVHRLSDAVIGASYCADDGQVNLRLLHRALSRALSNLDVGQRYLHAVERVECHAEHCVLSGEGFSVVASQLVVATGGQSAALAHSLGFDPLHTQIDTLWESEPTPHFMPFPAWQLRQSREGSLLIPVGEQGEHSEAWRTASAALDDQPAIVIKKQWVDTRCATVSGLPAFERSPVNRGVFRVASPESLLHCPVLAGPVAAWLAGKLADEAFLPLLTELPSPEQDPAQGSAEHADSGTEAARQQLNTGA